MTNKLPHGNRGRVVAAGLFLIVLIAVLSSARKHSQPKPRSNTPPVAITAAYAPEPPRIESTKVDEIESQFGARAGDEIHSDSTIMFVGGAYVMSPYRVSRHGLEVRVNNVVVRKIDWPGRYFVANDPPTPMGISRDWTLKRLKGAGPGGKDFIAVKARYLYSHYDPAEATRRYVAYFQSLPCIDKVLQEPEPGTTMTNVTIFSVHSESESMLTGDRDGRPRPVNEVIEVLEQEMKHQAKLLEMGGFVYQVPSYEFSCGRGSGLYEKVPEIVEVLESDGDEVSRTERLAALLEKPDREVRSFWKPLLTGYRQNGQLDARIRMIRDERG